MRCPKCGAEMEKTIDGDYHCLYCKFTWHTIAAVEIPITIDKTKAEKIDWLTQGVSPELLEREQKQAIKAEKKWDRRHARYQKRVDKAREKYHINDCPCCGEPRPDIARGTTSHVYWLECQRCYTASEDRRTIRGAIKAWNKIVPHDGMGIL